MVNLTWFNHDSNTIQGNLITGHVLTNTEILLVALVAIVLCMNRLQPKLHSGTYGLYDWFMTGQLSKFLMY